jgi:hypothetical protein
VQRRRAIAIGLLGAVALGATVVAFAPAPERGPGVIEGATRPARQPAGDADASILFGDLHVHTTYSIDAFLYSLPVFGGGGAHPPADACDFARHCSQLDFFSLNDHAEALTPERWRESLASVRACNARAGDPADPDLVSFAGWEWTQRGATPETHFGHRNVILLGQNDDEVPLRPITALPQGTAARARGIGALEAIASLRPLGLGAYADLPWLIASIGKLPDCDPDASVRELPASCRENAATPAALFAKLREWGFPSLVIPHGLAWGAHTAPAARLDISLAEGNHDPNLERLLEVFSGHGNSEEYRDAAAPRSDAGGAPVCPAPTREFLPCCWQAGELVRARCADPSAAECERRVTEARRLALEAGADPERVLPDAKPEEWLDCDQCRNCFKPAERERATQSAQYGLALRNFTPRAGDPDRFRFGFVASSDDHSARAGTGYKQVLRTANTDARGFASPWVEGIAKRALGAPVGDPLRAQPARPAAERNFGELLDIERGASFFYPGGLVAVHARGRSREAIWDALQRREVYGTSGPRILLWFDLVNAPGGPAPMGSVLTMREAPRFEVRAVGSFVQRPGCPAESVRALSATRLDRLCGGECFFPSEERHPIAAIEVVRVWPQQTPGEPVGAGIGDPWRRFECTPDPAGCVVAFEDPEFATSARDAVYYVRALQEPTPAINAANLRTEFDANGNAVRVEPCYAGWRGSPSDDCLAPAQERAWSSPIYVDRARGER